MLLAADFLDTALSKHCEPLHTRREKSPDLRFFESHMAQRVRHVGTI